MKSRKSSIWPWLGLAALILLADLFTKGLPGPAHLQHTEVLLRGGLKQARRN